MRLRDWLWVSSMAVLLFCMGAGLVLYNLPPVYERIEAYTSDARVKVHRLLYPPEEVRFVPQEQVGAIVQATLQALAPFPTGAFQPASLPDAAPTSTQALLTPLATGPALLFEPTPTETPYPSLTPSPTATPPVITPAAALPPAIALTGVRSELETRNNCGPATLAMALSYWGWQSDQAAVRAVLRPNLKVDDKNVMPAEMESYVQANTSLLSLVRVGGDLDLLKTLIAAGFPVIVEKGHITTGWIGHYLLLTGYDEAQGHFLSQDSLIKNPNVPVPYDELASWWRHFNFLYLVVYPPEREAEVLSILGPHADPAFNFQAAAEKARQEIPQLEGRQLFFAWFNLGSSLAGLGDFSGAAQAYDAAYGQIYPSLEKEERPWRALWYQTGPYQAYYSAGRYQDVIDLANATLTATGNPVLEETFYWRGRAREALGELEGALADYRKAARLNPNSTPALEELRRLGDRD